MQWLFTINLSRKLQKHNCALIDPNIAFTILFWFCLFIVILRLPPERTRGIIHEALDHM